MAADTGPAEVAQAPTQRPTPWVFRYRVWLIGGVFLLASLGAEFVARRVQVPYGDWMSLDPRLRLGSQLPPAGAPVWQLAVPSLFILAAMALRSWGTSYLRGHVMLDKELHTDRLIVAGPFRWCRNPLYLGNVLFAAGVGLYLPPPGLLFAVAGMGAAVGAIAAAEAKALRQVYGAQYAAYERAVPMFLPKPPRRDLLRGTPVKPDWANGLQTELWQGLVAVYFALLALRLDVPALAVVVLIFFGLGFLRSRNRRAKALADAQGAGAAGRP